VLDVACGLQGLKGFLPADSYFGCDINGGQFQCSAHALPVKTDAFQTVVLCEILEHLGSPEDAIREATRAARERVVVTVPNDYSLVRFARLFVGRESEIEPEHIVSLNSWNLARMFEKFGFSRLKWFCFPLRLQLLPEFPIESRFGYWLFSIFERTDVREKRQ